MMNEWERLSRQAQRYKESYPPGTRIMLISMEDPWAPVPCGTKGTVEVVDDIGQIHMKWDNGRKKWFFGEIKVSEGRFKEMFASLTKHGIYQYIYTK